MNHKPSDQQNPAAERAEQDQDKPTETEQVQEEAAKDRENERGYQ